VSPIVERIPSDETLPAFADVVVIGGGIVGAAAAYSLAQGGHSVALVEKGYIACEQSSRTWGWCRRQNRDARELPLSLLAMDLWDQLASDIGEDLGFRRCGLVYATDDPKQLAEWDRWREVARAFDIETHMLSAAEAAEKVPETGRKWVGGLHNPGDGKAEPALAAPRLAEAARRLGATIHQGCAVRGLDIVGGAVRGVQTEKGLIAAGAVLCAAGAWAASFLRPYGVKFPQASIRQTALRSRPLPNIGEVVYTPDCALTRRLDGSYTMAISGRATLELTPQGLHHARAFLPMFAKRLRALQIGVGESLTSGPESLSSWCSDKPERFERARVANPAPDPRLVANILQSVRASFPALAGLEVADTWGAYVDSTPDAVPVISAVDQLPGVYLAAGCSGHGFGVGPGIGRLAAELIRNDTPSVDPAPFRLSRFQDGTRVKVGAL
jgi:glycine/D-amino acid oxidase-like deaminating enzyme